MFEKQKIQEAYVESILNESADRAIAQAIQKVFPVKVNKTEVKRKIVFHLSDFVDDGDFDNFGKIDAINDFIKKKIKNSLVEWKGRTIEVEEL